MLALDSSRPCQPQSPDKSSGCPIWHGDTQTDTQADLRGLDKTQWSDHHGFTKSTTLSNLHNYSTRLSLGCERGYAARIDFPLAEFSLQCEIFTNSHVTVMRVVFLQLASVLLHYLLCVAYLHVFLSDFSSSSICGARLLLD